MPRYKFDDCVGCRFKRTPRICDECDFGEQFESAEVDELRFDETEVFYRAGNALTTSDDEPNHNPDEMIRRVTRNREDAEENDNPEDQEDE